MTKMAQELDKLTVFIAVAEKGKINEAAKVLNLTQPSVSRSIQKLEEAFEVKLFERNRHGVKLTPAGILLYKEASDFLNALDDLGARMKHSKDQFAGKMTVGTYESLSEYLWPDFLLKLRKEHPKLNLSIKTSPLNNPLEDLLSGKIDIVVDAEPQMKAELTSWRLYSDYFSFYSSYSYDGRGFDRKKAATESILYVQKAFDENRISIEEYLEKNGYSFEQECIFDSFSTVKRLIEKGMGIGVLPRRLAEEDVKKKNIKRLSLVGFESQNFGKHSIYATVTAERQSEYRIKKLVNMLRSHFRDDAN